jgi:hypothetical protein
MFPLFFGLCPINEAFNKNSVIQTKILIKVGKSEKLFSY